MTAWYAADWTIVRYLKKDQISHNDIFLDLYPTESGFKSDTFRQETKEDGEGALATNE